MESVRNFVVGFVYAKYTQRIQNAWDINDPCYPTQLVIDFMKSKGFEMDEDFFIYPFYHNSGMYATLFVKQSHNDEYHRMQALPDAPPLRMMASVTIGEFPRCEGRFGTKTQIMITLPSNKTYVGDSWCPMDIYTFVPLKKDVSPLV